ncbi:cell cycle checkpoint protein [Capsaspora owczarzaki ATCC 30864]|uniref:Cell cycle checkpoint protein n=1 Tax=Capsaspora owczarzaki (strain ATCC 30864) TaxID=595528 RepID=A0A0D2X098_CAPO3|nr:cell cycle checkpoint protein [Capsaspora owczarzaki ATCC 30864]KJE88684.1 cell cycle checkpoint protein [Capsaspora owczarzaki ATCC 30864]|eukprot:XP_004365161.1 cell cycle checkpoint protein [Capsaspora owczarzaki ATCC 30864]
MQQQQQDDAQPVPAFVARLANARRISVMLKSILLTDKNAVATVFILPGGIKFVAEDAKSMQANAFLQAAIFLQYTCPAELPPFKIHLEKLLDCLNIFSSGTAPAPAPTALKLTYCGPGSVLNLLLEEGGVFADCDLRTLEPDDILDFAFNSFGVHNKLIVKSEGMKGAFAELDTSSEFLEVVMSPDEPYLRLSTTGQAGQVNVDFPFDSFVIETFECFRPQCNRYRMSLIAPSIKGLAISTKTSMRMNARGFLSLQFMISNEDSQVSFVEYLCAPEDANEDSERDEESELSGTDSAHLLDGQPSYAHHEVSAPMEQ